MGRAAAPRDSASPHRRLSRVPSSRSTARDAGNSPKTLLDELQTEQSMTSPSQSSVPPTDIGTHCALPTCNALDFLPIECAYCSSRYCRQHATPSSHQCTADPASSSNIPSSSSTTSTSAVTTRTGPELKDLLPDAKRNKLSTGAHSAALSDAGKPLSKQQLALAALKKSIDARKGESKQPAGGSRGGAKVKNASSAIELMKLKQRATSADPRRRDGDVAMTDRWYMAVKLVDGAAASETSTREVWLRKVSIAYRTLP